MLNSNPVIVAKHFQYRLECLFKDVLLGCGDPVGKILYDAIRIEFQFRGSPHAHCFIWIKDCPILNKENIGDFIRNNKKRSHTQLDSRKQVIAFQNRVMTINIKEAQHPLKREKQVIDKSSIMLKISTKSMHRVLV